MTEKDDLAKQEADEFIMALLQGDVNQILHTRDPIQLKDIVRHKTLKCVLVEGAPGIGKSTFAWEVCKRWGKEELFQQFSLVVLLSLRDASMHNAKTLAELFHYDDEKLQSQIIDDLVRSQGKELLIVMDGLDELPEYCLHESSVFSRLINGTSLPRATLLITSLPSSFPTVLMPNISYCVEILGFTNQSIEDNAECMLKGSDRSDNTSRFMQYLSMHPKVKKMLFIPLYSAIVSELYRKCRRTKKSQPTITEICTSLSYSLLLRHIDNHPEFASKSLEINSFSDLPGEIYRNFKHLCELSFDGICDGQYVFSGLGKSFNHLGFMSAMREHFVDKRPRVSYRFMHLTVQEYLAAVHISMMTPDKQLRVLKTCRLKEQFKTVMQFAAGITGFKQLNLRSIRDLLSRHVYVHKGLQRIFTTNAIRWLYESQQRSCLSVFEGCVTVLTGEYNPLTPFDCLALGYCIHNSPYGSSNVNRVSEFDCSAESNPRQWNPYEQNPCFLVLDLSGCSIGDDGLQILASALKSCDFSNAGCIKTVLLSRNNLTSRYFKCIPQQFFKGLEILELGENNLDSIACSYLAEIVPTMDNLHTLCLDNNPIGCSGMMKLVEALSAGTSLKELDLKNTGIGSDDIRAICHLLSCSHAIVYLNVAGNELQPECVTLLAKTLTINSSLKTMILNDSIMDVNSTKVMASMLQTNQSLTELQIVHCRVEECAASLIAGALTENSVLKKLDMSANPIGVRGASEISQMLKKNNSLTELELKDISLSNGDVMALLDSLQHNAVVKIGLSFCIHNSVDLQYMEHRVRFYADI